MYDRQALEAWPSQWDWGDSATRELAVPVCIMDQNRFSIQLSNIVFNIPSQEVVNDHSNTTLHLATSDGIILSKLDKLICVK